MYKIQVHAGFMISTEQMMHVNIPTIIGIYRQCLRSANRTKRKKLILWLHSWRIAIHTCWCGVLLVCQPSRSTSLLIAAPLSETENPLAPPILSNTIKWLLVPRDSGWTESSAKLHYYCFPLPEDGGWGKGARREIRRPVGLQQQEMCFHAVSPA